MTLANSQFRLLHVHRPCRCARTFLSGSSNRNEHFAQISQSLGPPHHIPQTLHGSACCGAEDLKASHILGTADSAPTWTTHSWQWNYGGTDHQINYAVSGCGAPILLVHGFGASFGQWRNNIPELAKFYKVYAIDLLGFGASEKPLINYTIELWSELLADFAKELMDQPYVLVGNSIGSLISLDTARITRNQEDTSQPCGIVLINCAGGMNNKARTDDWRIQLVYPLFLLLDIVLKIEIIAARLFNSFRTQENVRQVLQSVYVSSDAVDDELIEMICKPADDPNALAVFVSVITGPPGPKPEDLMEYLDVPVLVLWGDSDVLTPVDGPVGRFFMDLPNSNASVKFHLLKDAGHCAQDDNPDAVHQHLLPWLQSIQWR